MSDMSNPLEYLYKEVKDMIASLKQQREWIAFMKGAGENTSQQELSYNNTLIRVNKWKSQLEVKGYHF